MLQQAFLFSLIPLAAAVASGVVSSFWKPQPTARSYIQHFAAGVVLAAVTGELLPEVVESTQNVLAALVGFVAALIFTVGIKVMSHSREGEGAASLALTAGVDTLVDGLVIGLGFVVGGGSAGPLLAVALAVELFFLGLSTAATVGESGKSHWWMIGVASGLGLLIVTGALAGVILLGGAPELVVTAVLAFGSLALLYLVTEELLEGVRNVPETPWHTLVLFAGFIGVFVIEMMVH